MQSFAPMACIERAVLAPMGQRLFANTLTTKAPSIAPAAPTEQAVLALTALRSCADRIRSTGPSEPQPWLNSYAQGNGF